ncbi:unnamed protein product [Larinioides sclopetarius]|uniref:Uncharacterized protein n=1 Tax=Larinioides sclopetarius TaxID=280406 RepID=A0AAV2AG08_9ARAC
MKGMDLRSLQSSCTRISWCYLVTNPCQVERLGQLPISPVRTCPCQNSPRSVPSSVKQHCPKWLPAVPENGSLLYRASSRRQVRSSKYIYATKVKNAASIACSSTRQFPWCSLVTTARLPKTRFGCQAHVVAIQNSSAIFEVILSKKF